MSKRTLSILGMASGVLIIIAALLMGYFGFPSAGFGPRKIAIALFGLLVLIVGIILFFWKQIHAGIIDSSKYSWTTLFGFTFLSVYVYILFEWIFTITKPSFLDLVPFSTKVGILFFTSAMVACLAFLVMTIFFALSRLPWFRKSPKLFLALASFIPVWIIASMILILVDNFTFTLFSFGIVNTETIGRIIYLVAYTFLFIFILAKVPKILSDISSMVDRWKARKFLVPALIVVIVASLLITYRNNNQSSNLNITRQSGRNTYPNIILITADGVNADHMSLYGYARNTTPMINTLASSSLIVENAFPNSPKTYSGLLSIFTSKDPTTTRVLTPPDILRGKDSYQHLPGVLKTLGYYTAQFSYPVYADAFEANMLFGFDYANGRSINEGTFYNFVNKSFVSDYSYFIYETTNRLFDRLAHIFFVKQMVNHQALVNGTKQKFDDEEKILNTEKIFSEVKQPIFIHLHWMVTHGPTYILEQQVFSAGQNVDNQGEWNDDFYDDNILEFDEGVGQLIDFLKANNLFDNTIIIISSDHGDKFSSTSKIPLLIHFPLGQYSGIRESDIQQLDIAPTLLDYLGIGKPSWIEGDSFLSGELPNRPIFSASPAYVVDEGSIFGSGSLKPPFYEVGSITTVYCNSWFNLELETKQIRTGLVKGHTQPCEDTVSNDQFMTWIIAHLKQNGFDTSTIKP